MLSWISMARHRSPLSRTLKPVRPHLSDVVVVVVVIVVVVVVVVV